MMNYLQNRNLSADFTLDELTKTDLAKKKGFDNTPTLAVIHNLEELCQKLLQPIRNAYGKPIKVVCGYLSPRLNAAVGGAPTSPNRLGFAVNIQPASGKYEDFEKTIIGIIEDLGLKYDEISCIKNGRSRYLHLGYKDFAGRQKMQNLVTKE